SALKPEVNKEYSMNSITHHASWQNVATRLPDRSSIATMLTSLGQTLMTKALPPVLVLAALIGIWEFVCTNTATTLPGPSQVLQDSRELILSPFYDNGGNDVGLGWQILASLERVAYGYSLAVIVGVALGVLVGKSTWAMRGLDPLFQILRSVPPLAW